MRLLSLQCDQPSFKQLDFRPEGLSVIVGDASRDQASTNGVGKTLALDLVHHCLGARADRRRSVLARGVGEWRFGLEFELADGRHRLERNGDGSDITLDGRPMTETALRRWLDDCGPFTLPGDASGLTFRSLYVRFARRRYDCDDPVGLWREEPHESLLRTLYLLGADISLAQRKVAQRERLIEIEGSLRLLASGDARLREFLRTGVDVRTQIAALEERVQAMEVHLKGMRLAEDYEAIRQQADQLTHALREKDEQMARIDFQLQGIESALQVRPDIDRRALLGFYEGLTQVFRPEALAHFEAVERFHRSLSEKRRARLLRDREALISERKRIQSERDELARERDAKMAYLKAHTAMEEYTAVAQALAGHRADLERLRRYGDIKRELENEQLAIRKEMAEDDQRAAQYVETEPLAWADQRYRQLVHAVYPDEVAGITLRNNTGSNKLRYDLKAQVESQGSDGINAMRVMAFDWLLLRHGSHHTLRHLWHDNKLFDPVDPHQRAAWLRLIHRESAGSKVQYILALNTENFESTRAVLGQDAAWLEDSVIVRLSGDSDEHKLLGVRIGVAV